FAWRTPEAVEACGLWCDVVSFNLYQRALANGHGEWALFHAVGKPALIGEFHFGSTDRGLFWLGLVGAGRESERGPASSRYLRTVADNADFGRPFADLPYTGLVAAARDANLSVLRELQRIARVGAGQSHGEGIGNGRATVLRFAQEGAKILAV